MSFVNFKKRTETKSDFYLSIVRANADLLVRYFEERDLSNENKLLIDKENELKRLGNKLRVIDDKRDGQESRKLLFVYDERHWAPNEAGRIATKHLSRKQSILLESFHAKNKVLVFRPVARPEHIPAHNRVKFKSVAAARERYGMFEKEMEITPVTLDSRQSVESLNREVAYYMKSDWDGASFTNATDAFGLQIYLYVLKIEVDHKTRNNSIKHVVFARQAECFKATDEDANESVERAETKKRRTELSKSSHTIRKMYMIQPRTYDFPPEIEVIFKNYNVCYVNTALSASRLEIAYSLSEYDINNNKVDVNELPASAKARAQSKQNESPPISRQELRPASVDRPKSLVSTANADNRTEPEPIRSEIEQGVGEAVPIAPAGHDKNFIAQNRKNVSKIPVLRSKRAYSASISSVKSYANRPATTAPKRAPGTNNPMSMLVHAATLKKRDNAISSAKVNVPVPAVDGSATKVVAKETPAPKPKEVIEVKLNAKNFFGEGFKDEVVKEIRYLANSIIESKKSTGVVDTRVPARPPGLGGSEASARRPIVASKLPATTTSASKTSLPTVYEDVTKPVTRSSVAKPALAKVAPKVNSLRSGSVAKDTNSEPSIQVPKSTTTTPTTTTTTLTRKPPCRVPLKPRPFSTTKISNSRTSSSIELPKIKKIDSQINQKSYVSLRNLPVAEPSRTKRLSTLESGINHGRETKSNPAKMSIDNLCCENNNVIPIRKTNATKDAHTERAIAKKRTDGEAMVLATPLKQDPSSPLDKIANVRNESIKKMGIEEQRRDAVVVEKVETMKAVEPVEVTTMKNSERAPKKPHFLKKLIKLARKN